MTSPGEVSSRHVTSSATGSKNPQLFREGTAKHHTRRQSGSPITAIVVKLYGDQTGNHADVEWNNNAGVSGRDDALALADRRIDEWRRFFQQHNLNPNI